MLLWLSFGREELELERRRLVMEDKSELEAAKSESETSVKSPAARVNAGAFDPTAGSSPDVSIMMLQCSISPQFNKISVGSGTVNNFPSWCSNILTLAIAPHSL